MTPKLSIIVPVYNTEIYLKECLDSIINQTLKDIEIIIVNDYSPDNSEAIILEYQQKDPRIKYIKHDKNLSQSGARNTGITNATGEWITFVDSDDYVDLNTYQTMISLIDKHQADLGIFSAVDFDDITKKETINPYFNCYINGLTKINYHNASKITQGVVWNKIFRYSDIIKYNITFPEHLKLEDEAFWFKYFAAVEPSAIGCNKKFYHYRQRAASTMATSDSKSDLPQICLNIYTFLEQHNLLKNYREFFIQYIVDCIRYTDFSLFSKKQDSIKFIQEMKGVLNLLQLTTNELQQNLILFYIQTTEIIDNTSVLYIDNLFQYIDNKWYKFGQLSPKQKFKKLFAIVLRKTNIRS